MLFPLSRGGAEAPVMYVITMRVLPNVPAMIARALGAIPHVPVLEIKIV